MLSIKCKQIGLNLKDNRDKQEGLNQYDKHRRTDKKRRLIWQSTIK